MMSETVKDTDQKTVIRIYAAFGASLVLSLFPSVIVAVMSLTLFTGVLISAYIIRSGHEEGSLTENHMTFIIRTIWIGCFFAAITLTLGSIYMLTNIDYASLGACAESLAHSGINVPMNPQMHEAMRLYQEMLDYIQPCIDSFINSNFQTFIVAAAIAAGPILLYFTVRYVRGLTRAIGHYRVANPKSWV